MTRRTVILWIVAFAFWTLNGLASAADLATMRDNAGRAVSWGHALRTGLASSWIWVPLTMGLVWLVQRSPLERGRVARALVWLNLAVLAVVLIRLTAVVVLNPWIEWYAEVVPPFGELFLVSLRNNVFLTWLIIGVAHAWLFAERAQQRERQTVELQGRLAEARLDALSAQLNPHFLFNALNSIAELVHQDANAADRMLVGLGALLRRSLESGRLQEISLREELQLLGHYVDLERVRLGSRLQLQWRVEASTLDASVPHLVLQPLVENAIRHAVSRRTTPGQVSVYARRSGDRLLLDVRDDGRDGDGDGDGTAALRGTGVGLANTRARLECLYGADYQLVVEEDPGGLGTIARLAVPYRPVPSARPDWAAALPTALPAGMSVDVSEAPARPVRPEVRAS